MITGTGPVIHITIDTSKFNDIEYLGQQIDQWYSSKK